MKILLSFAAAASLLFSCKQANLTEDMSGVSASSGAELSRGWLNVWPDRKAWYMTTQGSHLLDYDIFMHLKAVTPGTSNVKSLNPDALKLISSQEVLGMFGYIYPVGGQNGHFNENYKVVANSSGSLQTIYLPFGLLRDKLEVDFNTKTAENLFLVKGKTYLGESCAACHTSQATVGGKRVIIEGGGATTLDQSAFFKALYYSLLQANLNDNLKDDLFARVKKRKELDGQSYSEKEFKRDLVGSTNRVARFALRGSTKHPYVQPIAAGPGRSDAVSNILNALTGDQLTVKSEGVIIRRTEDHYDASKLIVPHCRTLEAGQPKSEWERDPKCRQFLSNLGSNALSAVGLLKQYVDKDPNVVSPDKSVSIPHVWEAGEQECVQYNCLAQSPVIRNAGEVLGVFGYTELNDPATRFKSTIQFPNLKRIENSLKSLEPPKWPESLLGPLDSAKVAQGKEVYSRACASCHVVKGEPGSTVSDVGSKPFLRAHKTNYDLSKCAPFKSKNPMYHNIDGKDGFYDECIASSDESRCQAYKDKWKGPFKAGIHTTDMYYLCEHGPRWVERGAITPAVVSQVENSLHPENKADYPKEVFACLKGSAPGFGQRCDTERASGIDMLGFVTLAVADKYFRESGESPSSYAHGHSYSKRFTRALYKARNLSGIAWTGPYLHNGSVRTLAQLIGLRPRQTTFAVGTDIFDPAEVGHADVGRERRDTTKLGNSNEGHRYGYDLSRDEKEALLEYLKSI